ncbi:MAG: DUF1080 domain-containing protein [Cyclobacteriaceae bacterium]
MLKSCFKLKATHGLTGIFTVLIVVGSFGQATYTFQNMDGFEKPGKTWDIAGDVQADLEEAGVLTSTKGTGILVNIPTEKNKGEDLFTTEKFGDMDLEVEYLVAKGSNSGIYLQGMYEIQILDSWGVANPRAGDNGGIYERWDESRPDGEKGYQGYAPRQNSGKAPGLWQKLEISFQSPRFDEQGNKIQNARMISVILNGVTIHENVELFGPTRGAMAEKEMAVGPLRIQGDHGAVAFRNLIITPFDTPSPQLKEIGYEVYQGRFEEEPDFTKLEPFQSGEQEVLSSNIRTGSGPFLIRYQGILETFAEGNHDLELLTSGGSGLLRMDGKDVLPMEMGRKTGTVNLDEGNHEFEILYAKIQDWAAPGLSLSIEGPGLRETQLTNINSTFGRPTDPILVDPKERPVLRSFMDLPELPRVTHAVSVGSEDNVHYTYDMDYGNLIQVWRGEFLNATPMWNSRGDGSSRPLGSVTRFGKPSFTIAKLSDPNGSWIADSTGTHFQPKGYKVQSEDHHLAFIYKAFGATVEDDLEILGNGQGIKRSIGVKNDQEGMFLRLAVDGKIKDLGEGLYLIGDKSYYIKIENSGSGDPILRNSQGERELLVPAAGEIVYSLLF